MGLLIQQQPWPFPLVHSAEQCLQMAIFASYSMGLFEIRLASPERYARVGGCSEGRSEQKCRQAGQLSLLAVMLVAI